MISFELDRDGRMGCTAPDTRRYRRLFPFAYSPQNLTLTHFTTFILFAILNNELKRMV